MVIFMFDIIDLFLNDAGRSTECIKIVLVFFLIFQGRSGLLRGAEALGGTSKVSIGTYNSYRSILQKYI